METNEERALIFASDPNLMECIQYMRVKDTPVDGVRPNMNEIAYELGMSRTTLYNKLTQWAKDGTFEKARRVYLVPIALQMLSAVDEVMLELPSLMHKVLQDAKDSKDPKVTLDAFKALWNSIALPQLQEREPPSAEEFDYVLMEPSFDPRDI